MAIEIKAPSLPESVPDGTIATWYKKVGQQVSRDELLVDIETDKVLLEVVAPADGVLKSISKAEGAKIVSNELLAVIEEGATAAAPAPTKAAAAAPAAAPDEDNSKVEVLMSPAARKLIEENRLDPNTVPSTGKDGRITKEDVVNFMSSGKPAAKAEASAPSSAAPAVQLSGNRPEQRVPMTRLRAAVHGNADDVQRSQHAGSHEPA
jgi:2-oxoglutarate dehydrogenase E2 component (dihydrolipoamide succinyltransferase)